jgi:dynactin complex subunit
MRFVIKDETVHQAFEWLDENAGHGAAAKAMRQRCEDAKKAAKARAFLKASGNNAEREAEAILTPEYQEACEAEYRAIEADELFRNERSKCAAIIECWRSCQATERQMAKVA